VVDPVNVTRLEGVAGQDGLKKISSHVSEAPGFRMNAAHRS
jgi:hypothetical protein